MKKFFLLIFTSIIGIALIWAGIFYYQNLSGAKPAVLPPPNDISKSLPPQAVNSTEFPLTIPACFSISVFAKVPGARVITVDARGNMWVSQTSRGTISLIEIKDEKSVNTNVVFRNLHKPHGLAFDPKNGTMLYFAEEGKISRVAVYSEDVPHKIIDLPTGGNHFTRTIGFGPDGRLYVSIGSTCNVCEETDNRRAKIYSMSPDGGDFKEYASGLRNSVFFDWSFFDGRMWATEMGRDLLGDNIPPDEVNIIKEGKNYGWPVCYGKNVHDTNFDKNTYIRNPCQEPTEIPAEIEIPAHSAPLGLAFVPEDSSAGGWPKDYWGDLFIAYHGSWNRSTPTGYKIVRAKFDAEGNFLGFEDFITGWLTTDNRALGRPVDIIVQAGGIMYVSDDKAGLVYKITEIQ